MGISRTSRVGGYKPPVILWHEAEFEGLLPFHFCILGGKFASGIALWQRFQPRRGSESPLFIFILLTTCDIIFDTH